MSKEGPALLLLLFFWILSLLSAVLICAGKHFNLLFALPIAPLVFVVIVALYFSVLFVISLFVNKKKTRKKPNTAAMWLLEQTFAACLPFCRVRLHVGNAGRLPEGECLVVSNHLSKFDPVVTATSFRGNHMVFVARENVFDAPLIGAFMSLCCYVPINRDDPRKALVSVNESVRLINEEKLKVVIYPEGTRSKDHLLHDFHPGSFKIASKAGTPIAVIALKNTDAIHKNLPFGHTDVYVSVAGVISAEEQKTMSTFELAEKANKMISAELSRIN